MHCSLKMLIFREYFSQFLLSNATVTNNSQVLVTCNQDTFFMHRITWKYLCSISSYSISFKLHICVFAPFHLYSEPWAEGAVPPWLQNNIMLEGRRATTWWLLMLLLISSIPTSLSLTFYWWPKWVIWPSLMLMRQEKYYPPTGKGIFRNNKTITHRGHCLRGFGRKIDGAAPVGETKLVPRLRSDLGRDHWGHLSEEWLKHGIRSQTS